MASVVQKELQKIFRSFGGDVADEELERMIADSDRIMKGLAGLLLSEAGLDESTSKPFALLDNACGIGPVSAHLQDHVDRKLLSESKVVCADFNENLVNILKRRAEKYHWINVETAVVDAQQSDFATDSFSHVTINFGMHIIPKPEAVLEDTMRILKPGGVLAFSTWHKDSEGPFSDLRSSFEALPFDAPMPNPLPMTPNGKPQWADPEGVEGELRAHGFVNIKVQAVPHLVRVNSAEDFLQMYRTKKEWMVNAYWNEDSKKRAQGMLDEHILNHLKEKYNGEGWDVSWTVVLATCVLPSYHYGAPIAVECMNRSVETGEHIQNSKDEIQWIPFPICNETGKPLEFGYGVEGEMNCTIPMIDDPFFHLLEFYIHSDAPLACRLPARPPAHVEMVGEKPYEQEYIPLVFALAGTLQLSHLHISTHLNILLHSTPKHHIHPHDSGVLDSGAAYSTSPLSHMEGSFTKRLVIGDPLPLSFSVRWFPTPSLPKIEGKVEWQGMGGHIYASTVFYALVSFIAGVLVSGVYFFGVILPKRLKGRGLGGATPLAYGLNGVGNGWGYSKRMD
ncbi:S-adenosyl-L-methionine-dependent methyltransferase [Daldinia caldariorum]|uniref:S-adenosyl-L-methionine-dependent methyltransferase n=1 Tax=Daldinia caldariorum TaxID=326644 RepID=UPI002007C25F|nr:S-adenosyl-L-methionine-dependent methyltransferase [Daldinia caldariorum]KAI1463073.1 S-adenosyl-L-methionine-dependent methyltransferase [Daldinia caldariorum]